MPVIRSAAEAPVGSSVYVLGFPLNEDFGISGGIISSHSAANGRWRTDNLITYGSSGGPAFDRKGSLIGIAVSGIGSFTVGGETRDVDGINFLIPSTVLLASELMTTIASIPQPARCWRDADDREMADGVAERPLLLARTVTIRETKDDHPVVLKPHEREYKVPVLADPGYTILGCTLVPSSVNNSSPATCKVDPGEKSATVRFTLTSGPAFDRWRGWWGGTATLHQRLAQ